MTEEMDFTALKPRPAIEQAQVFSWGRTVALAVALSLHAGLMLRITLPPGDAPAPSVRKVESVLPAMNLVFIDAPREATLASEQQRLPTMRVTWTPPPVAVPAVRALDEPSPMDTPPVTLMPDAATLQAQLPELARSAAGPLKTRPVGTLPGLPGRAQAFVPLSAPVRQIKTITPEQVGTVVAKLILSTMASNPDDIEKAREMRDPLQEMTQAHLQSFDEPDCADPDDPLGDRRCWDNDPNLRR